MPEIYIETGARGPVPCDRAIFEIAVGRVECCLGAILAGHIEAEPVIELIAGSKAEDSCVLNVLLDDRPARRPGVSWILWRPWARIRPIVIEFREILHADTDIAAQVPAARLLHDGNRRLVLVGRWRQIEIGGVCRSADHGCRTGADEGFNADHSFVLSSARPRRRRPAIVGIRSEDGSKFLNGS